MYTTVEHAWIVGLKVNTLFCVYRFYCVVLSCAGPYANSPSYLSRNVFFGRYCEHGYEMINITTGETLSSPPLSMIIDWETMRIL